MSAFSHRDSQPSQFIIHQSRCTNSMNSIGFPSDRDRAESDKPSKREEEASWPVKKKETGCLALLMKLIIPTVGVIERHTACYTVIITHVVLLASSPGLLCGLDNCSRLGEGGRVGVRLTLPGDATAGHGTETVPSRHKFTDSSLLAVNAVRQELLSRWYTHIHTHSICYICYIPNSWYESTPRVL